MGCKYAIFQVCRLILLVLVCALFNKPFTVLPAFAIFTANAAYLILLMKVKGFWRRFFTVTQLCASVNLCGMLMTDSMPNLPRFIERTHWTYLGLDAVVVLWAVFWASFVALAIIEIGRHGKRKETVDNV